LKEKSAETTEMLMRRLAAGLVSWLTFQQVALRSEMYSERFVYTPIFELASARGWRADHEFSVKLDSEQVTRRLDFVFSFGSKKDNKNKVVALEVKYISANKKQKTNEIKRLMMDEEKLKKFDDSKFHKEIDAPLDRYIMVIAKEKSLKLLSSQAKKMGKDVFLRGSLMRRMTTILRTQDKNDKAEPFGEIFYSPFNYKALWCVVIMYVPSR
jgi:hypothetical protein